MEGGGQTDKIIIQMYVTKEAQMMSYMSWWVIAICQGKVGEGLLPGLDKGVPKTGN